MSETRNISEVRLYEYFSLFQTAFEEGHVFISRVDQYFVQL
jgi:hypothetical protein